MNAYFGLASPDAANGTLAATPGDNPSARTLLITATHLATGVITLALTDFLDAYPDVTIQVAMMGGAISYVAEQIQKAEEDAGQPHSGQAIPQRLSGHGPERSWSARDRARGESLRDRSDSVRHRQWSRRIGGPSSISSPGWPSGSTPSSARYDKTGKVERVGGIRWTIKDGIAYDAKKLAADVQQMVENHRRDRARKPTTAGLLQL